MLSRAEIRRGVVLTGVSARAVLSCALPFAFAPADAFVVIVASLYEPLPTVGLEIPSRGAMLAEKTNG